MGKGQRVKTQKAFDNKSVVKTAKKKNNNWVAPLVAAVIILVVVGCIVLSTLESDSVFLRHKIVMSTDNFEVTGTMFQYAYAVYYNSLYSQYSETYSDYISYLTSYIQSSAVSSAKSEIQTYLLCCEAAKAEGKDALTDEEKTDIEEQITELTELAESYDYGSLNSFLKTYYGVKEKDVRAFLEFAAVGSRYQEELQTKTEDSVTDEIVNNYFTENYEDYVSATYYVVSESVLSTAENYEDDCLALWTKLSQLTTSESATAFLTKAAELCDDEDYSTQTATTKLQSSFSTVGYDNQDGTTAETSVTIATWLYGETLGTGAEAGSIKIFANETSSEYQVNVYYVDKAAAKDTTLTYNIVYLLAGASDLEEEDANAFVTSFNEDKTVENFLALAEEMEDVSSAELENTTDDWSGIDDITTWMGTASVGDIFNQTVAYNSSSYRCIVYYSAVGHEQWYVDVQDDWITEQISDWQEDMLEQHPVTADLSDFTSED